MSQLHFFFFKEKTLETGRERRTMDMESAKAWSLEWEGLGLRCGAGCFVSYGCIASCDLFAFISYFAMLFQALAGVVFVPKIAVGLLSVSQPHAQAVISRNDAVKSIIQSIGTCHNLPIIMKIITFASTITILALLFLASAEYHLKKTDEGL